MTTRRPRVYVAHSVVTYGTEHEATTLAAIVAAFPGAEIVNPAGRYRTNAGWLRAWPRLLPTLDVMVVFCDEDGCIGAGCLREIADAIRVGTDVGLFTGGRLRELRRLDLLASGDRSAWRAARPVAGRVVRLVRQEPAP